MEDTDVKLIMDLFDIIGDKLLKTSKFAQDTYEKLTSNRSKHCICHRQRNPKNNETNRRNPWCCSKYTNKNS